jgi:type IV/VI secretion system ImpK/VasF family protein
MTPHQSVMKAIKPMTDYLLHLKLRFASNENIDPGVLREELKGRLEDMQNRLSQLPIPGIHNRFETIKYIFAALSDEIIYHSNWEYSDQWLNNPLEAEVMEAAVAGEEFFRLLERDGLNDPLMAELFYTCLVLGFGRDRPDYHDLKRRLYMILPDTLPENEQQLSPGAETYIAGQIPRLPPMFGFLSLAFVTVIFSLLYVSANHILWERAADFLRVIRITLLTDGY